jgi:SAM-dependent methyltransferase
MRLHAAGATREVEGMDASPERVAEAEKRRREGGAAGRFLVADVNRIELEPERYDLIVSAHSFHHFLELEHVMEQVARALTPRGVFVLEEFVGPTQFQWTDAQIDITRTLTALLADRYRTFRWGAVKPYEGRPAVADVVAASPFESIRSAEIGPLFESRFRLLHRLDLGGTIQHLLYNGIIHNFPAGEPEAEAIIRGIFETEDALVDSGLLPSDFQLLIGEPRGRRT